MSKEAKVHMPLYTHAESIEDLDALRIAYAAKVGVPNISRGDYFARLVKEEKERQALEDFGTNKA